MTSGAEQTERGDAHGETVARLRGRDGDGGGQRRGLGGRQGGKLGDGRGQQIGQGRERELRLGLDAAGPQHRDPGAAPLAERPEEGRLADPGLTTQDQRAASPGPQIGEQSFELGQLLSPANDHATTVHETGRVGNVSV
jgi:hypothetical protein